jgi:hypothetical protein
MLARRIFFASLAALAFAAPAMAQSILGTYTADGRNPDGSSYSGTVWIEPVGKGYTFRWQIGSQSYAGSGTQSGDVVTVNWGDTHPVFYLVMPDGELHGTWADGLGLEKLTPR